jgi:uncharacterized protein YbjT (DUF2867 family)
MGASRYALGVGSVQLCTLGFTPRMGETGPVRIAVAGGTGLVGRVVVARLAAAGHEPVVLARSQGVDLVAGTGLDLVGVGAVIDATNVVTRKRATSEAFFGAVTRNLLEAERAQGTGHHVALSIVGCDRVDLGYYYGKRTQEDLVQAGGVPFTILRTTQFHEFAGQLLAGMAGPVAVLPRMRIQPVAAAEVADRLVELALGEPRGTVELAGPLEEQLIDVARRLLHQQGSRRKIVPVTLPGAAGRQLVQGGLLPTSPGLRGTQSFAEWLKLA